VFQVKTENAAGGELSVRNVGCRWKTIALGGMAAGTLDIIFATSIWHLNGVPAVSVLQTIASGLVGKAAYAGGATMAVLGLVLHFIMTVIMAWIYHDLTPDRLLHKPLISGSLYGACIWAAMNFAIVPLSAAPVGLPPIQIALADLAAHMLLVGVPIALLTRMAAFRGN
jgi:hypothetical protein